MVHKSISFSTGCIIMSIMLFVLFTEKTALGRYDDTYAFQTANDFLNAGQYLEALGMYQEIAGFSDNPGIRAKALFFSGRTYSLYLGRYEAALNQFNSVMTLYPDDPYASEALFNSGMVLYETGNYKKAYDFFSTYITSFPQGNHRQSAEVWADSAKPLIHEAPPLPPSTDTLHIPDATLRVLLKKKALTVTINSGGRLTVYDPFSEKTIYTGSGPLLFSESGGVLSVNNQAIGIHTCGVKSDGITINLDGRNYRGRFVITATDEGLTAANHVQTEFYLYGVVPKEMPVSWPEQALMAQAVAARTYALYIKEKSCAKPYDVEATVESQVYGGYDAETQASSMAVDATRGQVMAYEGKLIIAYFHSCSGGYTEDAANVWGADMPYLKGVPDTFSVGPENEPWEYFLPYAFAEQILNKQGLITGSIKQIETAGISESGRALNISVISDSGTSNLNSNNFRIKVGGTQLKSTLFQTSILPHGILFKGKGYGHGVGMSQWGANMMAKEGYSYQDILKHYYQQIKIVSIDF